MNLLTLIADLEQAARGSRELSDRVLLACSSPEVRTIKVATPDTEVKGIFALWGTPRPSPTENIADALALIEDGLHWECQGTGWAAIQGYDADAGGKWRYTSKANKVPLAICAANLKAIHAAQVEARRKLDE